VISSALLPFGTNENITTFVRALTAVFTVSFVAKPEINLVYDVHEMLIRRCYHRAIFLKRPVAD
jgi:hypothetical protein